MTKSFQEAEMNDLAKTGPSRKDPVSPGPTQGRPTTGGPSLSDPAPERLCPVGPGPPIHLREPAWPSTRVLCVAARGDVQAGRPRVPPAARQQSRRPRSPTPHRLRPAEPQLVAKLPVQSEEGPPNHKVFCREMRAELERQSVELAALTAQIR
ncbi:uncharacterized protein LOC133505918 [Syngnathoides biaculeatus]|uniref:uncharacterized protein LOC133505918 n=1 Tax=Syngnathoides biaculeatus TaxID=300417 RepID=UPI002ADDF083|nr:uncharacterized protein LOC133505918 [Syngnathoides biaculeatus]